MKPPTFLPTRATLPAPVLFGVLASWIPVSAPVMIGLVTTVAVYAALLMLASFDTLEPAGPY